MISSRFSQFLKAAIIWVLGIFPTCFAAIYVGWIRTPLHHRLVEAELGNLVGRPVCIQSAAPAAPGRLRLDRLTILGPGNAESIFLAESVLWTRKSHRESTQHHFLAENCTLKIGEDSAATAFVNELFLCRQAAATHTLPNTISAEVRQIRVQYPGGQVLFAAGKLEWQDAGNALIGILTLWREEGRDQAPLEIRVVRDRSGQSVLAYGVHTGTGGLPVQLLRAFFANLEPWGFKTAFEGYLWVVPDSKNPQTELAGIFHIGDIAEVMGGIWAPCLQGKAQLLLRKARLLGDKWHEGEGILRAEAGNISQVYVRHLWQSLGLQGWMATTEMPEVFPLEELAFRFAFDSSGVLAAGACGDGVEGTLLRSSQIVLVTPPAGLRLSWSQLLASILPPDQAPLPSIPGLAPLIARIPRESDATKVASGGTLQPHR
jgi:hypothetical protein